MTSGRARGSDASETATGLFMTYVDVPHSAGNGRTMSRAFSIANSGAPGSVGGNRITWQNDRICRSRVWQVTHILDHIRLIDKLSVEYPD